MIVVDVNVLLAAHREDHPRHPAAKPWLEAALSRSAPGITVPDLVWVGFIRVATNRRVFDPPSGAKDVIAFVKGVTRAPGYLASAGLRGGLGSFLELVETSGALANLVPDAYIAAHALAMGAAVATFDTDFHRFAGLELVSP
jgi:toxin-antitoxin system PIN domain toxin